MSINLNFIKLYCELSKCLKLDLFTDAFVESQQLQELQGSTEYNHRHNARIDFIPLGERVEVNESSHFCLVHVLDSQRRKQSSHAKHRHRDNRHDDDNKLIEVPELFEVRAFMLLDLKNFVHLYFPQLNI